MGSWVGSSRWLVLCASAVVACAEPPPIPEPPPGPPRSARQFLPFRDVWIPESEIPRVPQESPHMVIWELSEHVREPTDADRAAADELHQRCLDVARERGWFDFEVGKRDGYRALPGDNKHFVNEAYLFDEHVLDCERPEFLMYYDTPGGMLLAGVMFYARGPDERGPQVAGPLTVWHYHIWKVAPCLRDRQLVVGHAIDGECREGEPSHRSPEMMHVWFLEHPGGKFGTSMHLTREQLARAKFDAFRQGAGPDQR